MPVASTSQPVSSRVSRTAASVRVSFGSRWPAGWLSTARPPLSSSTIRKRPLSSTRVATVMWGCQVMGGLDSRYDAVCGHNGGQCGRGLAPDDGVSVTNSSTDPSISGASPFPHVIRFLALNGRNRNPGTGPGLLCILTTLLQLGNCRVEGVAWAHGFAGQLWVRRVVAADVHWLALYGVQLGNNSRLVVAQGFGQFAELRLQCSVFGLGSQGLSPVQRQVEVAAAVVDVADFARWRLVVVEELASGLVQGLGQHQGFRVVVSDTQMLKRRCQGQELAQGIPAQEVLFNQLLHVFRSRTAGAGFEQAAAVHQRHDRQHLGAGAQFHDREQVGQVVAQYVAGHRDGVQALAGALQGELHRVDRRHDADVQAVGVVVFQVSLNFLNHHAVVRALWVQPENGRGVAGASTVDGQFDPVLDRRVFGMAHAEDVAGFNSLFHQQVALAVGDADNAVSLDLESLVVGAVLFGFFRHQANVWHAANGGWVESAIGLAVFDDGLVDGGVAAIRDHRLGVVQLAVGAPHLAVVTDHGRHRGVDDDVARHVQVGDAFVGVDHRQGRASGVDRLNVSFDLRLLLGRQVLDASVQVADAVVQVEADLFQNGSVLGQGVFVELGNDLAEHDRVGDLHHGGFEVNRQQHALFLGIFDFGGDERAQGFFAQHGGINDFAGLYRSLFFQHGGGAVFGDQLDLHRVSGFDLYGFFAAVEVAVAHVSDVRLGVCSPGAHFVRVLACVVLDRQRRAAVRVAFAQYRVHGAAIDLVVTCTGFFFRVGGYGFRVVRQGVALGLQLLDRSLQLRGRGADVRQLDDVGFRRYGQVAQFGEVVRDSLGAQLLGEACEDARGEGNVAGFHSNISGSGEGLYDRQQ